LITQALYCLVFVSRYLDVFQPNTPWNTTLKIFYILSSIYILFLMLRVYARTRERETAWKLGALCLVGSAIGAPFIMMIFKSKAVWGIQEVRIPNLVGLLTAQAPRLTKYRSPGSSPLSSNPSVSCLNLCYCGRPQSPQSSIHTTY
jgi:hypothetical protein